MRFSAYTFTPSISPAAVETLKKQLFKIDNKMVEANDLKRFDENNLLIIGTVQDVFEHFEDQKYYISDVLVGELSKSKKHEFPFSNESRQLISQCLSDHILTYISLDFELLNDVSRKAALLGAQSIREFDEKVTVVISTTTVSLIVYNSWDRSIPVVSPDWILRSFNQLKPQNLTQFYLQPFAGCIFTSSDMHPTTSKALAEKIIRYGGSFHQDLTSDTNFVITSNLSKSKKNLIALSLAIPLVKPEWVEESIANHGVHPRKYTLNWFCMDDNNETLFSSFTFGCSPNVENQEILFECITANSGVIINDFSSSCSLSSSFSSSPDYFIAEHGIDESLIPRNSIAVTDHWILRCVEEKRLLGINDSVIFQPRNLPLKNENQNESSDEYERMENVIISLFNISEKNRTMYADIVRDMGWQPVFSLSKHSKYIIAEKTDSRMYNHVNTYKIPAVKPSFLIDTVLKGKIVDHNKYLLEIKVESLDQVYNTILNSAGTTPTHHPNSPPLEMEDLEKFTQGPNLSQISQDQKIDVSYDTTTTMQLSLDNNAIDPLITAMLS